jgi:hypothetical protein
VSFGADVTSNTGGLAGGADVNVGNVQTGSNQTQTQTGLRLSIFEGDSDTFSASFVASVTFPTTFTGTGNQGEAFRPDSSEAGSLQTMLDGREERSPW